MRTIFETLMEILPNGRDVYLVITENAKGQKFLWKEVRKRDFFTDKPDEVLESVRVDF